jgi:Baseplate J-like protein.
MANSTPQLQDGISQQRRHNPALQPDYARVDERSLRDLLAFVRDYSGELRYFDEQNEAAGDWQAFFPQDVSLDDILAFLANPTSLPENKAQLCQQPHFVLLLSFLQLLALVRQPLNDLTRRHLDFHFRQFLQLREKPARPDHVHVLVELAKHAEAFPLPAGTLLDAGKDSTGNRRLYATDQDTLLNQARIAQLSALYVDKKITGFPDASGDLLAMLKIALGHPAPGDELPFYPVDANTRKVLDADFLNDELYPQLNFIRSNTAEHGLNLSFHRFAELVKYQQQREPNESMPALWKQYHQDWGESINAFLKELGTRKNPGSTITFEQENDFNNNFKQALGFDPYKDESFPGLPDISSIDELYTNLTRDDVQDFLKNKMFIDMAKPEDQTKFETMMQTKIRIDSEWERIDTLLAQASGKQPVPVSLPNIETKLQQTLAIETLNQLKQFGGLNGLHTSIQHMQDYFFMSAYDLYSIITTAQNPQADSHDWNKVYQTLTAAHQNKVSHDRQQALSTALSAPSSTILQLTLALPLVLGSHHPNHSVEDLRTLLPEQDFSYLNNLDKQLINPAEMDKVYATLMIAWRNREGADPVAEKAEWQGVYASNDVTTIAHANPIANSDTVRWKTFGQLRPTEMQRVPSEFGLAISSPILLLSQSRRDITLTFTFSSALDFITQEEITNNHPFSVLLSSKDSWLKADPQKEIELAGNDTRHELTINKPEPNKLQFTIILLPDREAITAPTASLFNSTLAPIIKIIFNQNQETYPYYQKLKALSLIQTDINTDVSGLTDINAKNDLQPVDIKKPFEPFGSKPVVGSRFHIESSELSQKRLSYLSFNIEWINKPDDDYYNNYRENASISISEFKIDIGFNEKTEVTVHDLLLNDSIQVINAAEKNNLSNKEPLKKLYWELKNPDFQHTAYPAIATRNATNLAIGIANQTVKPSNISAFLLNPPYTPTIKKLTIDYQAFLSSNSAKKSEYSFYHIYPFGHAEVPWNQETQQVNFLPQFDDAGELYIGLEKLKPPQHLSLLFQMAEGSANADLPPETIRWDYLSGNQWHSLADNILSDATQGLINSGIIRFSLPASQPNTLLPPAYYWLRASIPKYPNSVCDTVAIHTQAIATTRVDMPQNAPDALNQPLPSGSIKKLLNPLPAIKAIQQPYTAFGGKGVEPAPWFYTRVSERLRHKQRALTPWDYEHLVLEHFPQIYKVKCIPASLLSPDKTPGTVEIIVIPDIRNRLPADPFAPKAPVNLLTEIRDYLQGIAPDAATIVVNNARYVPFKIRMGVRFHQGYEEGYYKQRLNEAINRFLAPWAYDEGADITIGSTIYANSIINFVERLPYIDYIAHIRLFGTDTLKNHYIIDNVINSISTKDMTGILIPEPQHEFDPIPDSGYQAELFFGINYMKIGLDFQIA